jgi:ribonucleoside-diphosphate reductase subunit M1
VIVDGAYVGGFTEMWENYLCPEFDFIEFGKTVELLVHNLNKVIDLNSYPLEECRRSNFRHRPIGIGVQGLADVFFKMRMPYDSTAAREMNSKIFEALYYYALSASNRLAEELGPFESFDGSPLSKGLFHFDLCDGFDPSISCCGYFDWDTLRTNIMQHGTRNSLLIAPMPTASTSQIMGNTESFEPLTNNLYVRRTLVGEFYICNEYLRNDLEVIGKWNNDTIEHLIIHKGSIQQLNVPNTMKQLYRTVWEIPQKALIDMAAERQYFIDQSQSFNIYLNEPNMDKLTKIHFYGWKKGLKTGSYYIRSRSVISSQNVTIDPTKEKEIACESCSA